MGSIHTFNVRDHIMLPFIRDRFNLSPKAVHEGIHDLHQGTVEALRRKGVNYTGLRSALTPSSDKNEVGFMFNSTATETSAYGRDAMNRVLPLLDRRSNHSFLHGDLLGRDQQLIFTLLRESIILCKNFIFRHSSQLFCIYINNLSDVAVIRIHKALSSYKAYIGYVPATFSSRTKTYLSTTLGGAFLKYGSQVLLPHEDDRPDEENVNLTLYSFEDYGFNAVSLSGVKYSLFLSFKIERPVYDHKEDDACLSINAMSDTIIPLHECDVLLEEPKYKYIESNKLGKLQKAGLSGLSREELARMIKAKISSNYIYNICYLEEYEVVKFNIMLEIPHVSGGHPTRLTVALEYMPKNKLVRVLTLF